MDSNPSLDRHMRLEKLALRLHRTKRLSRADLELLLEAAHAAWDDAHHFAAPWDARVSLCGNWGRNLISIDDKGDVGGARCWTCLHIRDWLVKNGYVMVEAA